MGTVISFAKLSKTAYRIIADDSGPHTVFYIQNIGTGKIEDPYPVMSILKKLGYEIINYDFGVPGFILFDDNYFEIKNRRWARDIEGPNFYLRG